MAQDAKKEVPNETSGVLLEISGKPWRKRRKTRERGGTGHIKTKKKTKCGVGIGERRIVDIDMKEITLTLMPMKSLGEIIKYTVSEVLGKKVGPRSKTVSVITFNSIFLSKRFLDR